MTYVLFYLFYIYIIDGTLRLFINSAPRDYALIDLFKVSSLMANTIFGSAINIIHKFRELDFLYLSEIVFVFGFICMIDSIKKIFLQKQLKFLYSFCFLSTSFAMIISTCMGRFGQFGFAISHGDRYWYYSILFALGILFYLINSKKRILYWIFILFYSASSLILAWATYHNLPYLIEHNYQTTSIKINQLLHPGKNWRNDSFNDLMHDKFENIKWFLERKK